MANLSGITFFIKTFGCQMNLSDTEVMTGLLLANNATEAIDEQSADVVIFVTCCVRENADSRVYGQIASMINDPVREGSTIGRKIVAVGGCMAQRDGEKLLEMLPNVDVVFGTHTIEKLPELLVQAIFDNDRVCGLSEDSNPIDRFAPTQRKSHFQAWLPIMKGCNNFCTYCIVPYVRGREISRDIEDVAAQAKFLVEDGVREITLLGQNVNSYGRDLYGEPRFHEVLRRVAQSGIERIRFVTSHPKDLTDQTIDAMAELDCVMPALHLPVQSGSDAILHAMNRVYDSAKYYQTVEKLKSAIPDIALSTDIIVGFPGETEDDFQATYDLVKDIGYSQVFTFIYSKREGTSAAKMIDNTPHEVIQDRFDRLVKLVQQSAWEQNQKDLGSLTEVLVEGTSKRDDLVLSGRSPKNQTVHFKYPNGAELDSLLGKMAKVKVDVAKTWYLSGELISYD